MCLAFIVILAAIGARQWWRNSFSEVIASPTWLMNNQMNSAEVD